MYNLIICTVRCVSLTFHLSRIMSTLCRPLVAVCQVTATPDKKTNLIACKQLVEEAKERGASMVFLPEAFDYIGSSREETLSLGESLTGDTMSQYTQLARYRRRCSVQFSRQQKLSVRMKANLFSPKSPRKLEVWLSLGGFHERGHDWESDRRIYNSHIIINDKGSIKSSKLQYSVTVDCFSVRIH